VNNIRPLTRKGDIVDDNDDPMDIHTFIDKMTDPGVKQLYEQCGRRIVSVENKKTSQDEKNQ
jgi:hypothetical protein